MAGKPLIRDPPPLAPRARLRVWPIISVAARCVLALFAGFATAAFPQIPVLEEIIVTARKRPESLQHVPVSVNVTFGEQLTTRGINSLEELHAYVPNLTMAETAIGSNILIRGIGSGVNQGFEQSVGIYVDGIYHGRAQLARLPFFDLERVEVLRGPQTTLFGNNSIAGALSLVTAAPTEALRAELLAQHEPDLGDSRVLAVISGPLSPQLAGRLAIRGRTSDGYLHNALLGRDEPQREERAARATLSWSPSETLALTLKVEIARFDVVGRQIEIADDRPALGGPFSGLTYGQILSQYFSQPPAVLDARLDERRGSNGDFSNNDARDAALTAEWDLGSSRLTAITGYSAYEYHELCDCDITAADIFTATFREDFDQISQEIRLTSPLGNLLEYVAGVYVQRSELDFFDALQIDARSVLVPLVNAHPRLSAPPFPRDAGTLLADTAAPRTFTQRGDLAAVFGQAIWRISDELRLSFGARFTAERKRAERMLDFANVDGTPIDPARKPLTIGLYNALFNATPHRVKGRRRTSKVMPSLALEWDPRDAIMTYASIASGFKSGGFDARSNNPPVNELFPASTGSFRFGDEKALNVEVGAKMRLGGGRGELHGALYVTHYEDLQVSTYDGTLGFNVGNAGEARIRGMELEGRYRATPNVQLSAALALTDFEYRKYFGQCYFGRPPDAADGVNCSYRGRTNQYVPDWAAALSADWLLRTGDRLALRWITDLLYVDDYFLSPTLYPEAVQRGHLKLNSRISLSAADGRWELALLGQNLTDERTLSYGNETPLAASLFAAPGYFGFVEPPRSVALQARVRWP